MSWIRSIFIGFLLLAVQGFSCEKKTEEISCSFETRDQAMETLLYALEQRFGTPISNVILTENAQGQIEHAFFELIEPQPLSYLAIDFETLSILSFIDYFFRHEDRLKSFADPYFDFRHIEILLKFSEEARPPHLGELVGMAVRDGILYEVIQDLVELKFCKPRVLHSPEPY